MIKKEELSLGTHEMVNGLFAWPARREVSVKRRLTCSVICGATPEPNPEEWSCDLGEWCNLRSCSAERLRNKFHGFSTCWPARFPLCSARLLHSVQEKTQ